MASASIPSDAQLVLLNATPELAASLAYLAGQAQLDHVFANQYEAMPYHSAPEAA